MSSLTRYGLSLLLLVLTTAFFACSQNSDSTADKAGETDTSVAAPIDSLVVSLIGIDSVSVLDLLRAEHAVEVQESAMGAFVKSIDSVENSQGYFWLYSVNDSMGKVAADKYLASDSDVVKWHYRKIGE